MTGQELINAVKDNLGNRATGKIGNQSVDSVILKGINIGIPHLVLEAQPDYYNRTATVSITTSSATYAMPVEDDDGNDIRVKDIYSCKGYRSDGTPHTFIHLNYHDFVSRTMGLEQNATGTPCHFAIWGMDNTIHLDYLPTDTFSMILYVVSHPIAISATALTVPLPIHAEWDLVLEAFVTAYCYLKLQQTEMYVIWNDLYLKQKASVNRDNNLKQSHNLSMSGRTLRVSDPLLDPFVGDYNVQ